MRAIQYPFLIVLFLAAMFLPGQSSAQDAGALAQRLERLERDIQTLSKMVVRGPDAVAPAQQPSTGGGQPLPQNAVARIGVRLDTLEAELRDATGRIEELTFKLDQLTQRVDRLVADVDFRLSGLEQQNRPAGQQPPSQSSAASLNQTAGQQAQAGDATPGTAPLPDSVQIIGQGPSSLGKIEADRVQPVTPPATAEAAQAGQAAQAAQSAAGAAQPPVTAPAPQPVSRTAPQGAPTTLTASTPQQSASLPDGSPDEQYKYAFGLLRKHQFDQAEGAFRAFLETNSDSNLAGNARYWLGETHYARAEYVKAAEVFLQGFEKDPKGTKAPDSLLKLAMSLGQLGQTKEACGAIAKLFADFPDATSSLKRTATRQQRQMKCK